MSSDSAESVTEGIDIVAVPVKISQARVEKTWFTRRATT